MVYITGDLHGDLDRLEAIKLKKGDTLIVCGDFGFVWDGSAAEEKTLRRLGKKKWNICFIDGTHEGFDLLDEYDVDEPTAARDLDAALEKFKTLGLIAEEA